MSNVLTLAVQSLHDDQTRMDGISRNLANVSTHGYRRETFVAKPFADVLAASAPEGRVAMDLRPGTLKRTGAELDVAIEGSGFFEVATASGPAYTRDGSFQVDARGRLVTPAGDSVMGTGGEISLGGAHPTIDSEGRITEAGRPAGQLKAVRFAEGTEFERLGAGLLKPQNATPAPGTKASFRQGYVETSNVSAATEMVRLVDTMRHFESTQKVLQARDEMLEHALRKLGDL
jgi:flagellar basal-body rod protein FlgF